MAAEPDFEAELYALYGQPSEVWPDGGVTERLLAKVAQEERRRGLLLVAGGGVGTLGGLACAAYFGGPIVSRLTEGVGGATGVIWAGAALALALFGWAATRTVQEA